MKPKENFRRYFTDGSHLYMPSSRDLQRFAPAELPDNRSRGLVRQQVPPDKSSFGGKDWLGIEWFFDPASGGSMEKAPVLSDFRHWEEVLTFPDLDAFDWQGCAQRNADYLKTDKMISCTIYSGFFERLISMAGFENAAIALIDEEQEDAVCRLFDRLVDHYVGYIHRMHKYFGAEHFVIHDDWGSQRNLLFSKSTNERMILPFMKRLCSAVHRENCFMELHSCGKIEPVVPLIIEAGFDTWCGQDVNDKPKLVREFGDRFKFCVEMCFSRTVTDEQAMQLAADFVSNYKGTNVWLYIGRGATPAQADRMFDYIYSNLKTN